MRPLLLLCTLSALCLLGGSVSITRQSEADSAADPGWDLKELLNKVWDDLNSSSGPYGSEDPVCKAGTFYNVTSDECEVCPAGSFSKADAVSCTPCAAGTYNPETKQAACLPCQEGTFSS